MIVEFWVPLGILGVVMWLGSGWFTHQVFSQTYSPANQITINNTQQVNLSFSVSILSIDAEIDRQSSNTEVGIRTGGSSLQELEFEYPFVNYADLERAIAQDLGLQPEDIQDLIRYRLY
jgi:hypothetical protein